jgi:hypothetical protein
MAAVQTMHQIAPHTWTFEAPEVPMAPMKAQCRACAKTVAILRPTALDLHTGNYIVKGECERCGGEVVLILS